MKEQYLPGAFELALAADRSYMFHDDNEENVIALSPMNFGPLTFRPIAARTPIVRFGVAAEAKTPLVPAKPAAPSAG